jgi:hypothetical protein
MVFHLPLRQTEGFLRGLTEMLEVELPIGIRDRDRHRRRATRRSRVRGTPAVRRCGLHYGLDVPAHNATGRVRWTKPFSEKCSVRGAGIHAMGLGTYPDDSPVLHRTRHREVAIGRLIKPDGEFPVDDRPTSESLFHYAREEFMSPNARFPE